MHNICGKVFQAIRQNEKNNKKNHTIGEESVRRKSGVF